MHAWSVCIRLLDNLTQFSDLYHLLTNKDGGIAAYFRPHAFEECYVSHHIVVQLVWQIINLQQNYLQLRKVFSMHTKSRCWLGRDACESANHKFSHMLINKFMQIPAQFLCVGRKTSETVYAVQWQVQTFGLG